MVQKRTKLDVFFDTIIYGVLFLAAVMSLLPIIHTVALSFSDKAAAVAGKVGFLPIGFNLSAYEAILVDKQFWRSFLISIERVVLGVSINMIVTVLAAYPLSKTRRQFHSRNIYMWFLVFTMLFSGGMIPTYMVVNKLGLLDTIWALVLPGAVPVFNVIILMNYFKGIPNELYEAANMDGASPWTILLKIYLPLARPALATIVLFCLVNHWNAFFDGIIYINDSARVPLQTYIQRMVIEVRDTSMMTPDQIKRMNEVSNKTFNAAKIFVTMVPIMAIYPFLQKHFVKGLVIGSVKG